VATTASTARANALTDRWVALLGRQDSPTDGVEDYSVFLGQELAEQGVVLERVRVPWIGKGRMGAMRQLRRKAREWRGHWVLLQFTMLGWSRRGFPFLALAVVRALKRSGVRVAIVFHDSRVYPADSWQHSIRSTCQRWIMRRLHQEAMRCIFTVPTESVEWLPKDDAKSSFIPIGANIPATSGRRIASSNGREKSVIVFGITGAPNAAREVQEIAAVMREASQSLGPINLIAVGRGSAEAGEDLTSGLAGTDVKVMVRGILPAASILEAFESVDVLLFVRGVITLQRGSVMAGIASGTPIVGYRDGNAIGPLERAGIEWSPVGERQQLVRSLITILSDSTRWADLHDRNRRAFQECFSWPVIAQRFRAALGERN
jgi:glycosyltransferase involved in cell wall biosynthesis